MVPIDRVYKTLLRIANSDIRGNNTPEDIKVFINDAVNEIYEDYFPEVTRYINRQNRGLMNSGIENMPDRIREKINHFLVEDEALTYAAPYFTLPSTVRYIVSADYLTAEIDLCKSSKEFRLITRNPDTTPTTAYPIGLKVGNTIKVAPDTIVDDVTLTYLRKPLLANWAYVMVSGAEQANPSAADYRDIDLHPSEESKVMLLTLKRMGINLKDQELAQYAIGNENVEFNQDNTQ